MIPPVRVGIVGTGFMADVHAHAVRAAGGVVAAVVTRRPADDIAARFCADRVVGSIQKMLAVGDVDVVHVCTPNHTHRQITEDVLAAGRAVVCEKPLATTLQDARRMAELAQQAQVLAAVPFVYRFHPCVREARARIAAGEAGSLWLLHGSYLQDWLAGPDRTNWRVDPREGGASRAFGDIGVHWCDLMEFTTGHRIVRLCARMNTAFATRPRTGSGTPTEDGAVMTFETDLGAIGSLVVSQVSPGRKNRLWFSFDGTQASYCFDQEQPESLWIGGLTENRSVLRGPDTLAEPAARYARLPAGHPQGYQDAFTAFVRDVHAALRGGKPEGLPGFADGLRAAVLTQAAVDSAAHQRWVEVPA